MEVSDHRPSKVTFDVSVEGLAPKKRNSRSTSNSNRRHKVIPRSSGVTPDGHTPTFRIGDAYPLATLSKEEDSPTNTNTSIKSQEEESDDDIMLMTKSSGGNDSSNASWMVNDSSGMLSMESDALIAEESFTRPTLQPKPVVAKEEPTTVTAIATTIEQEEDPEITEALILTAQMLQDLESDSPFFEADPPVSLTLFDPQEIRLGDILGEGEFGTVREVTGVALRGKYNNASIMASRDRMPLYRSLSSSAFIDLFDESDDEVNTSLRSDDENDIMLSQHAEHGNLSKHEMARLTMKELSVREGRARYAVKRVREDLEGKRRIDAALDLAAEAMFLSSLCHPNIARLRGAAGLPGHPGFMMVMDRLYLTLDEKIEIWALEANFTGGKGFFNSLGIRKRFRSGEMTPEIMERITVAYDIARALNFLHERNIIFRDLKPCNLGFDVRGNIRLFDFGVAKELKKRDHVDDGLYACTPLTGTRRWMAPEVVLGRPYGLKADVYSFSLLLWHLISLKIPYGPRITPASHLKRIVKGGRRPRVPMFLPKTMKNALRESWNADYSKRPKLGKMCVLLSDEIHNFQRSGRGSSIMNRTVHLKAFSTVSLQRALEKIGGISTRSDMKMDVVAEIEATETEATVERSAMMRLLTETNNEDDGEAPADTRPFVVKGLPMRPSILVQSNASNWLTRNVFGGDITCTMPASWSELSASLPETRELYQDANPATYLLKMEIRSPEQQPKRSKNKVSRYFDEIVETCEGETPRFHPVDSHVVAEGLTKEHKAQFSYGKGTFQMIPSVSNGSTRSISSCLQVELCIIHFDGADSNDLIICLSTMVPPLSSQHPGLSETFARLIKSIRIQSFDVFYE